MYTAVLATFRYFTIILSKSYGTVTDNVPGYEYCLLVNSH